MDLDGSGTIEFDEFMQIMTNIKRGKGEGNHKKELIVDFFKRTPGVTKVSAAVSWRSSTSP